MLDLTYHAVSSRKVIRRTVMAAVFVFFFLDFMWFYRYLGSLEV